MTRPGPRIRRRTLATTGQWPDAMPSLLQRIYAGRGATSIEQAQPKLAQLLPPRSRKSGPARNAPVVPVDAARRPNSAWMSHGLTPAAVA